MQKNRVFLLTNFVNNDIIKPVKYIIWVRIDELIQNELIDVKQNSVLFVILSHHYK